jgi:hypothetical protein
MTATQISVSTAPREIEGLKKAGRFNLRVLAQELGLFENEAAKTAFMSASNDQQAETVLKYLLEKDGGPKTSGKGGGGAASGRAPSTKNAGKGAATNGKATGEPAAGSGGGGTQATGGAAVGAGAEKILQKLQELIEKVDGFQGEIENLNNAVTQLQGISAGTNRFVALSIGLSGQLAQQVLGAGLEQILDVTLEDMPAVEAAMKRMAPVEEADEAEDEGNEEE